jgi:hypothetical protein
MSDIVDGFKAMDRARKRASGRRRSKAEHDYRAASAEASANGMWLDQHSEIHYTLRHTRLDWRWELYPGNQRIYVNEHSKRKGTPFLPIPRHPWSLLSAVRAAVKLARKQT